MVTHRWIHGLQDSSTLPPERLKRARSSLPSGASAPVQTAEVGIPDAVQRRYRNQRRYQPRAHRYRWKQGPEQADSRTAGNSCHPAVGHPPRGPQVQSELRYQEEGWTSSHREQLRSFEGMQRVGNNDLVAHSGQNDSPNDQHMPYV